jgi:hypothetical protein
VDLFFPKGCRNWELPEGVNDSDLEKLLAVEQGFSVDLH